MAVLVWIVETMQLITVLNLNRMIFIFEILEFMYFNTVFCIPVPPVYNMYTSTKLTPIVKAANIMMPLNEDLTRV